MRVSREKAAENRSRVIDTAGKLFRERGLDGVGVADIMKSAGLTHGGFYGQFDSKEALAQQACKSVHERSAEIWRAIAEKEPGHLLPALVDHYVSKRHRDGPSSGCGFTSLAMDAARDGKALQKTFADGLGPLVDILAQSFPSGSKAQRRRKALATMAQMVGAISLARAVGDSGLSDEVLAAVRREILAAAGLPPA